MIPVKKATYTVPVPDIKAGGDVLLWKIVCDLRAQLGELQRGGLRITFETGPNTLAQLDRPHVGIDWTTHPDVTIYQCCCGWETDDLEVLTKHLKDHGAKMVVVTPDPNGRRHR